MLKKTTVDRFKYVSLGLSILFLLWNKYWDSNLWVLGVPLWLAGFFYSAFVVLFFYAWIKFDHLMKDEPIKDLKNKKEHFDKVGYSLFTGGLVAFVITDQLLDSLGLIVLGVTSIIISGVNQKRYERFLEALEEHQ